MQWAELSDPQGHRVVRQPYGVGRDGARGPALRLAEALQTAGVEVELRLTAGAGHCFANGAEHFETVYAQMERFLLRHLV